MDRNFAVPSVLTLAGALTPSCMFAQAPDGPAFEVTTIKMGQPGTAGPLIGISAGRMTLTGFTLKELMVYAYWIHPSQVIGTSGWMDSDKFDVTAKPEKPVPEEQLREMLQKMLADRFRLTWHRIEKQISAYELVVAKNGPKMKARTPGDGGPGFRLVVPIGDG